LGTWTLSMRSIGLAQEVMVDGPFGEGGDGGALALAGDWRQIGELGQVGADRRGAAASSAMTGSTVSTCLIRKVAR
jgi:hypothetical protein